MTPSAIPPTHRILTALKNNSTKKEETDNKDNNLEGLLWVQSAAAAVAAHAGAALEENQTPRLEGTRYGR